MNIDTAKCADSYLSSLELRRLAIEYVARLHALGEHPYRSIEHALDVRGNLIDEVSRECSSMSTHVTRNGAATTPI